MVQISLLISGCATLSTTLTLHNVLYVMSFHLNLISIPKSILSHNCYFQFTYNYCHILQTFTKEMIGISKMHKGLYVIDISNIRYDKSLCYSVSNANSIIWHYILGNISHIGLHAILKTISLYIYKEYLVSLWLLPLY